MTKKNPNLTYNDLEEKIKEYITNEEELAVINKAYLYVVDNVRSVANPILALEGDNQERMNDLLMQVSASANIFKILTETITKLPNA